MKPIIEAEGYFVKSDGIIYSTWSGGTGRCEPTIRKAWISNSGYEMIKFHDKDKSKTFSVHQLVAEHFVEGKFEGAVINHKDRNKLNNNYTNLEWTTQKDNLKHMDFVRNFVRCKVYKDGLFWGEFHTVREMSRKVAKHFNISGKSFEKYGYNKKAGLTLERCRDYPIGE